MLLSGFTGKALVHAPFFVVEKYLPSLTLPNFRPRRPAAEAAMMLLVLGVIIRSTRSCDRTSRVHPRVGLRCGSNAPTHADGPVQCFTSCHRPLRLLHTLSRPLAMVTYENEVPPRGPPTLRSWIWPPGGMNVSLLRPRD